MENNNDTMLGAILHLPKDFLEMWQDILRGKTLLGKIFIGFPICVIATLCGLFIVLSLPLLVVLIFLWDFIAGVKFLENLSQKIKKLFYVNS